MLSAWFRHAVYSWHHITCLYSYLSTTNPLTNSLLNSVYSQQPLSCSATTHTLYTDLKFCDLCHAYFLCSFLSYVTFLKVHIFRMWISLTILMLKIRIKYRMDYIHIFLYSYYLNILVFHISHFLGSKPLQIRYIRKINLINYTWWFLIIQW